MQGFLANIWTKKVKTHLDQEESEKLTEKVFTRRIAVGIISIVFCLSAMGISAYAFFTSNITSAKNTLTAATYEIDVVVEQEETQTPAALAEGTPDVYPLNAQTDYVVTLKASGNAQNGYCKIEVLDGVNEVVYYTKPLSPDSELTFVVQCYEKVDIKFTANWGSYGGYVDNPPTEDNCLYTKGVWSTGFAIGTPATSNSSDDAEDAPIVDEETPEQEHDSTLSEDQQEDQQEDRQEEQQEEKQDNAEPNVEEEGGETEETASQQSEQEDSE